MTFSQSCCRMVEDHGAVQVNVQGHLQTINQLGYDLDMVRHEMSEMQDGLEEIRLKLEDGVALVCVCMQLRVASCHVGCACS